MTVLAHWCLFDVDYGFGRERQGALGRDEAALIEAGGQSGDRARIKERRPRA